MVHDSWLTMQEVGEQAANACAYDDPALIRLDPADHDRVSADIPAIGGPTGLDRDGTRSGEDVLSHGSSTT